MPLNTSDPYYRAEITPPQIKAVGTALCAAFSVGADHFGVKGNTNHLSGYHRSWRWIINSPDSRYRSSDYSVKLTMDDGPNDDDCSAFDLTPGAWGTADNRSKMRTLTSRLISACQVQDPRVANLREVAGTLDGGTVVTYDCSRQAFKAPFDTSHLDHIHASVYRSRTRADHSGIVAVMLGHAATPPQRGKEPMIISVQNPPADAVDVVGEDIVHNSRVVATPGGPYALLYGEFIAYYNANGQEASMIPMSWSRVLQYCSTLDASTPVDAAALAVAFAPLLPAAVTVASLEAAMGAPGVRAILRTEAQAGAEAASDAP